MRRDWQHMVLHGLFKLFFFLNQKEKTKHNFFAVLAALTFTMMKAVKG